MSSKVHRTEEGLESLKTRHDTLSSHVDTIDRELTSVRTKNKELSYQVDMNLTALRNQQLDNSTAPLSTEG